MLEYLDRSEVIQAINIGMLQMERSTTDAVPAAESCLVAGHCETELAKGAAAFESLSGHDKKMIQRFIMRSLEPMERNALLVINKDMSLVLSEGYGFRQLSLLNGRVLATVIGEGADADFDIMLSDEIQLTGSAQLTHARVKDRTFYLVKQRDPMDVILSVIGLASLEV